MTDSARDRLRRILDFGNKPKRPAPASRPPAAPPAVTSRPAGAPHSDTSAAHVSPAQKPASSPSPQPAVRPPSPATPPFSAAGLAGSPQAQKQPAAAADLQKFLGELRGKMAELAEDFAQGKLNRMQFQEIYTHYQHQRQQVEEALISASGLDSWQSRVPMGMTGLLRERHAAKILSYAIYDNGTSLPLASAGEFRIDTSLLVPMLSSFRSAATEMFGAGLRSTEIEGGHWLCFVPGEFTTLMVLFSVEPARVQLTLIEDLHRDFEIANHAALANGRGREAAELFTRIWALDKAQMY
jgi:hypothetical protein